MSLTAAGRIAARMLMATALIASPIRADAADVLVFAAAGLTNALDAVAAAWTAETGYAVVASYAGSSTLARQIEAGAPADIVMPASVDWMDTLEASGNLREGTRRDIVGNRLVLIAHGDEAAPVEIDASLDLATLLEGERLSMALVEAVPAGIYGKAALTALGQWEAVAPLVVQSDNVRTALAFVAQGEVALGIVYATDAVVEDSVSVIGMFPEDSHPPIIHSAAITAQSASAQAAAFLDYLSSDAAREIWAAFGFSVLD